MMIEDTRSSEEKLEQALSMISGQELPYTAPEKLCEVPGTFDAELSDEDVMDEYNETVKNINISSEVSEEDLQLVPWSTEDVEMASKVSNK